MKSSCQDVKFSASTRIQVDITLSKVRSNDTKGFCQDAAKLKITVALSMLEYACAAGTKEPEILTDNPRAKYSI